MFKWLSGLFDSNEKELKRIQPLVDRINELEPEFEKLSDEQLRSKTESSGRGYRPKRRKSPTKSKKPAGSSKKTGTNLTKTATAPQGKNITTG